MKPKLLVVDDDPDILGFIELLIDINDDCECELFTATTGEAACKIIQSNDLALILLDVYLPDTSGYDLCNLIKENRATQHIPVYLFSASASGHDESRKKRIKHDGIISKPFDNDEFLGCINRNLKPCC